MVVKQTNKWFINKLLNYLPVPKLDGTENYEDDACVHPKELRASREVLSIIIEIWYS